MEKYYVHKDGRVYLVKKKNKLFLPYKKDLPFEVKIKGKINCRKDIYFCNPEIDYFPKDWIHNDDLINMKDVDDEVKDAFIYSLCRPSAGGIILNEKNEILMVKANRGFTKGYWNTPGGFLEFGENPEEGLKREILEETGYKTSIKKLHNVYSMLWEETCPGYYMLSIYYILNLKEKIKDIDKTEIEEIRFMPIEEAIKSTKNKFVEMALKDLSKEIS